jgi:hypothetical protein
MKPSGPIVEAAIREFGEPNWRLSSARELRFGRRGSVSVNVDDGVYFDFEADQGGTVEMPREITVEPEPRVITAYYDYVNEHGEPVMQVVRYQPKDFRQRRRVDGKWVWNVKGVELVPYRLPEVIAANEVVIVEGEKDVETLCALNVCASCKPMGSGKWPAELSRWFADKDVLVLADADEAGRKTARSTAEALTSVARSVRLADPFGDIGDKADVSDFVERGGDVHQLLARVRKSAPMQTSVADVFPTVDADAIEGIFESDDFVEGLLIKGQMSVLYGPSNSGKTFFASDLAMHVALGRQWRGLDVTQQAVLYVAAEGSWGIRNRVLAFRRHYEVPHLPLTVMTSSLNMYDSDEDMVKLIATIRAASERLGGVGLVVIDTLARVMGGGDENTASDMGLLVQHVDELCSELGLHVMLVHHSGKDVARGARGSSSLRAATATEIEVEPLEGMSVAHVTKQRDLEIAGEFGFGLVPVTLGVNARGKPVTSCIVEAREAAVVKKKQRRPSGKVQRLILREMAEALASFPQAHKIHNGPTVRAVREADWQKVTFSKMSGEERNKWAAWRRAVDALVADEFIYRDNEMCWVVD